MPLTLVEYKSEMVDVVSKAVVDEIRRSSYILDNLPFDDTAYPDASGYGWIYRYHRIVTPATASTRAVNTEYTPQEAKTQAFFVQLAIFGGSFEVDRTQINTSVFGDRLAFQLEQKIKAVRDLFNRLFIKGDTGVDTNAFDGLDKALVGATTEHNAGGVVDLSTSTALDNNYKTFLDEFELWLSSLDGRPSAILGNRLSIAKIRAVARRSGYHSLSEDAFGRPVDTYAGIPLIDLGEYGAVNSYVIPVETRTIGGTPTSGLTDIYAVRFGMDGVHGIAPQDRQVFVRAYLPDLTQPGAVKKGEVEMLASIALKTTKAAGVFRNVKVL